MKIPGFTKQGVTVRKRWTGLLTSLVLVSSLTAINSIVDAKADDVPGQTWTVFAAGDIAKCDGAADEMTAALIKNGMTDRDHTRVLMLGDGAYKDGSFQTYMDCYDKAQTGDGWGQFKDITLPAPGNHDYGTTMTASNAGYRQYWNDVLTRVQDEPGENTLADTGGWYSTDIGNWHIISLNWACGSTTNISCKADGPQAQWLAGDLAKAKAANKHIIAMWHGARFFSANDNGTPDKLQDDPAPSGDAGKTNGYWAMLQEAGADIVLASHHHNYERFARMSTVQPVGAPAGDSQGQVDPVNGIRQFVVGTGGGIPHSFKGGPAVGSEARIDKNYGVLKLQLRENSYDWEFLSSGSPGEPPAGTVLDSGSDVTKTTIPGSGTTATTAPAGGTTTTTTTTATNPPATGNRQGYWMVGSDGKVYAFGTAQRFGDAGLTPGTEAVDLEPTPSGNGYWVVDSAGGVSSYGDAVFRGGPDSVTLAGDEKVTSLASTSTGKGYWMFTDKGRVLNFGDAVHHGDMAKTKLNGAVLDSIVTPTGKGYYMVGSDGGIFSFGDAKFYGSMGDKKLNAPVQSLVPDSDGVGYWLVASDGGIFAFDAPFKGSMGSSKLNKPVTGMVRYADGYMMVGEDGGIFNFSSTAFLGSLGDNPPARPIVSVAALG
jgi:hypothetical protein